MDQETPTLTIQDSKKSPKKLKIPSTIKKTTKTKKFSKKTTGTVFEKLKKSHFFKPIISFSIFLNFWKFSRFSFCKKYIDFKKNEKLHLKKNSKI